MSEIEEGNKLTEETELPSGSESSPKDDSELVDAATPGAEASTPSDDAIRRLQTESHRDGRSKATQELLAKLNVGSVEELAEVVGTHQAATRQQEDKLLVDKEEKQALVSKIRELQDQNVKLSVKANEYDNLSVTTVRQAVREEAVKHGVREDALEDLITMAMKSVRWSDGNVEVLETDEKGVQTATGTMDSLIKGLKSSKSYLFKPESEAGPRVQGSTEKASPGTTKKRSDLSDILGIPIPR